MGHTREKPYHPQIQGKIERYHCTLKNVVPLRNYYLPDKLELEIGRFVDYYNNKRVHESLQNLTPADVYNGRSREILAAREWIKVITLRRRMRYNRNLPVREEEVVKPAEIRAGVL